MSSAFKKAQKLESLTKSKFDEDLDEKSNKNLIDLSDDSSDEENNGKAQVDSSDEEIEIKQSKNGIKKITKANLEKKVKDQIKQDKSGELSVFKDQDADSKEWKNRQRTLVLCARGVNSRFRHLMSDMIDLLPQGKKENKVERKIAKDVIDELCFQRSCNNCIYFEQRKKSDYFLWLMKSPNGPSIKFAVQNIHTSDELKLTGNCLKYSRPIVSFDQSFDTTPFLQMTKEMLTQAFTTPKNHPKSKPFIDHVISFSYYDGRVWFRNYQVVNQHEEKFTEKDDIEKLMLIEIGPRFCLQPIKAFDGTMGGEALWQNPTYITPSKLRSRKFEQFVKRREQKEGRKTYKNVIQKGGQDPDGYLQDAFI